eukprot:CAMPEP_0171645756 /NCGR_PEP_ID=MMETSP0990-20121206/34292_1 /TAXON_ID=483369 /ORGANISM="non described non described, Strain CCMP2098" /LENGTH=95 /DNA_ID=CAMNT_0012222333 /DNA_START=325 /DNA_END=612 /DNA_ORIENTATION=-
MTGRCAISPSQVTGHEIYWKLSFYSGGISTFLMAITRLLKDIRRQRVLSDGVVTAEAVPVYAQAEVVDAILTAPRDSRDPTLVWISDAIVVSEDP